MISYFQVKGQSMEPLCKEGDFVLLDKVSYIMLKPKAGDMVVLRHPQQEGRLILKYVRREKTDNGRRLYWVEGLNKAGSFDSRDFGWVPRELILGRGFLVRQSGEAKKVEFA